MLLATYFALFYRNTFAAAKRATTETPTVSLEAPESSPSVTDVVVLSSLSAGAGAGEGSEVEESGVTGAVGGTTSSSVVGAGAGASMPSHMTGEGGFIPSQSTGQGWAETPMTTTATSMATVRRMENLHMVWCL